MKTWFLCLIVILLSGVTGLGLFFGFQKFNKPQQAVVLPVSAPQPNRVEVENVDQEKNNQIEIKLKRSEQQVEHLTQLVQQLSREQDELRRQLYNANRDIAEMQFQLDSHSETFRPLKTMDK